MNSRIFSCKPDSSINIDQTGTLMTTSDFMMPDYKGAINEFSRANIILHGLPACIGLAAGVFACYAVGFNPITLMGTIILTLIGVAVGWSLFAQHRRQIINLTAGFQKNQQEQNTAIHAYINELEKLFLKVNPILLRQVQSSRFHTEREVTALTEQFSAMVKQLEKIISSSGDVKSNNVTDTLNNAIEETKNIFDSIDQIIIKKVVNNEDKSLNTHISKLELLIQHIKTSEQELNQIANEVNLTYQTNSQIPSETEEISNLAHALSASVEKSSQTNHHINAILISAVEILKNIKNSNANNMLDAKDSLNNALMQLKSILSIYKDNTDRLRASSEHIHHEICAVLVAFQFQDRVSQMLAQVENNLACLDETLQLTRNQGDKRHADMINIEQTLQQMKLDYSMPEQHANHIADVAVRDHPSQDDELTFF